MYYYTNIDEVLQDDIIFDRRWEMCKTLKISYAHSQPHIVTKRNAGATLYSESITMEVHNLI